MPETHSTAMVSEILVDAGEREDVDGILLQLPAAGPCVEPTKHEALSLGLVVVEGQLAA